MTFNDWQHQNSISFDDWFITEWDRGELRDDEDTKRFLIEYVQEKQVKVLDKTDFQQLVESIFQIKNRYFRIRWSTPCAPMRKMEDFFGSSSIVEVRKVEKQVAVEMYIPI